VLTTTVIAQRVIGASGAAAKASINLRPFEAEEMKQLAGAASHRKLEAATESRIPAYRSGKSLAAVLSACQAPDRLGASHGGADDRSSQARTRASVSRAAIAARGDLQRYHGCPAAR
jgi:hypothetical protein